MYTYANAHTHTLNFVLVQPRFLNLIQYVFTLYQNSAPVLRKYYVILYFI